jgi:hypothetical protein
MDQVSQYDAPGKYLENICNKRNNINPHNGVINGVKQKHQVVILKLIKEVIGQLEVIGVLM